jgi:N-acetylmuramoyl-L-alanine amidase
MMQQRRDRSRRDGLSLRAAVGVVCAALVLSNQLLLAATARTMYQSAQEREQTLRASMAAGQNPSLEQFRSVAAAYDRIVRRYPASGYSDNALWQSSNLRAEAYSRFHNEKDLQACLSALRRLQSEYPSSSLVAKARAQLTALSPPPAPVPPPTVIAAPLAVGTSGGDPDFPEIGTEAGPGEAEAENDDQVVMIRSIRRTMLPDVVRVTLELDSEVPFHEGRLSNPARMFVDLKGTRPAASLTDTVLTYDGNAVKQIKIGRHPQNTTRVVLDLQGVPRYSVFTLYNPFRLVVDCERPQGNPPATETKTAARTPDASAPMTSVVGSPSAATSPATPTPPPAPAPTAAPRPTPAQDSAASGADATAPAASPATKALDSSAAPLPSAPGPTTKAAAPAAAPAAPSANLQGGFSLARQLGLSVARIVIDPGHGGHDPGAQGKGISEADLVLDIALRLEKRLLAQPGVEVVLTRRTDVYIPLEERTAIANRALADLFLSIHANASRNEGAHGIETYYLNFASNPDAEAVAARENSASGGTMSRLPDIVKAIALNNKLDESRDFATFIQQALVAQLRPQNKYVRDLGVRQAPFVVLIGASMPSVLAEISFVTNRQEAQLLRGAAYRQRIAEALLQAVIRYQKSLKKVPTVASSNQGGIPD